MMEGNKLFFLSVNCFLHDCFASNGVVNNNIIIIIILVMVCCGFVYSLPSLLVETLFVPPFLEVPFLEDAVRSRAWLIEIKCRFRVNTKSCLGKRKCKVQERRGRLYKRS